MGAIVRPIAPALVRPVIDPLGRDDAALWTPLAWGADVAAWYNADDITAASGSTFQFWGSRLGGPQAYQNTINARMVAGSLSTGAKAAAVTSGTQWMRIDSALCTVASSIFIVFQWVGAAPTSRKALFSVAGGSTTGGMYAMCGFNGFGERSIVTGNGSKYALASGAVSNNVESWVATDDATGPALWVNAVAQSISGPLVGSGIAAGISPSAIAAYPYTGVGYYIPTAKIREVVVLTRKATTEDVVKWAGYTARTSGV